MTSPAIAPERGEQVRRNWSLLLKDILFCAPWAFSSSPVHFSPNMPVLCPFSRFIALSTSFFMNELMKIDEQYCESMRQFALSQVNK